MTDEKANATRIEREALVQRIFDLALNLTADRLENVDPKERKDNMAFDRVARTAHAFLRVADDAHALSARQQKDDAAHDEGASVRLPDDDEINQLEIQINQLLARQNGGRKRGSVEAPCEQSAGAPGVAARGGA